MEDPRSGPCLSKEVFLWHGCAPCPAWEELRGRRVKLISMNGGTLQAEASSTRPTKTGSFFFRICGVERGYDLLRLCTDVLLGRLYQTHGCVGLS